LARVASTLSSTPEERLEALKFIIHFLADIHSPMHVGFDEDGGGNLLGVFLPDGTKTTLHEVWDRYLVPFELDSDGFDIDWSGQLPDE
jgi:hypothetical protein